MSFNELDKLKAAAIVNIFETGRPFGSYAALAVLDDGAGISYGISQFTHRSGSLAAVVTRYLENGGVVARAVFEDKVLTLRSASRPAISRAAGDRQLKNALRAAAVTREMREAQHFVAFERYLSPAIGECARLELYRPLSLAVVYDSMVHGSWERIRDRVNTGGRNSPDPEKTWTTAYVKARHTWLRSVPRLRSTSYRTSFFLMQILAGNWGLELPVKVHGYSLSLHDFPPAMTGETDAAAGPLPSQPSNETSHSSIPAEPHLQHPATSEARPQGEPRSTLRQIGADAADLFARYDRIESAVRILFTRADSAKSLWTMVGGTAWQAFWGAVSFFAGLPREVWLAVAIIAALLMLAYLYRQVALGRIRELRRTALFNAERNGDQLPHEYYE
ncbi:MAG: chitosanase [Pyrinomonadaceae bacterium]